ncbi:SAM-dependent methyltransferase, BioC-like [hydrothermal vent metagenome]|uniref:SAM-dependent methyltransferase, BioC-like n=1 Tax=hydrothermal vent metagenome TaxID=652676 RepID=A0A3B0TH33_9ZZZZ
MASINILIDRSLARARDGRAQDRGGEHFLLDAVAADLTDRVAGMSASFSSPLDLSPRAGILAGDISKTDKARNWILAPSCSPAGEMNRPVAVTDEEWLPFAPASFDLVVSGLGLHRVNDLPGALIQINRALKPDGLFLGALFGGATLSELKTSLAEAEAEITGGASPRVMPFADVSALGQLMSRAGFALPVADVERRIARYTTMFDLVTDLRAMGETNSLKARSRTPLRRKVFLRAGEIYAARFADPDGRLRATFDIVTLTGWHPHASQQQPLAPGSAKMPLADALKAVKS